MADQDKADTEKTGESGEIPADIRKMTFEEAMSELETVVDRLESGDVSLEDSIAIYTRGTHLRRHCENKLKAAQEKIEKIVVGADGTPSDTAPFDVDE